MQLTEARAAQPWLAEGSVTVQQQALRDLDQAWRNFFAGTHRRPTWRRRGRQEGFRIVGGQALRVRQDNRRWSAVLVPKVGWVKLRRSRFDVIRFEDLDVAAMTRSAKGTLDAPGRVEDVPAAYSSQRCSRCGQAAPDNRKSQAVFRCTSCGMRCNADLNAARNIADGNLAAGRAVAARGDQVTSARSVKREPQRNRPPKVA